MKKTVSKLLEGQTKNITDLKNFMFAKDYWKAVDKNSDSVENAIKNSIEIGRKSVKTASSISFAVGICAGSLFNNLID